MNSKRLLNIRLLLTWVAAFFGGIFEVRYSNKRIKKYKKPQYSHSKKRRHTKLYLQVLIGISVILISFFWTSTARADTSHCGNITADETWSDDGNVHTIGFGCASVTVNPGVTLTITEGATIKFGANKSLIVNGALVVSGTSSDPVYFTSYRDDTADGDTNGDGSSFGARGDWDRIQFNDTSDDAASLIDHAVIRYGGDNYYTRIYGAVKLVSASPTIQNTEFAHNQYCAITANLYSFPTLTSNNIHNNERNAFCLYGGDLDTDATLDITDTVYFLLGDVTVALNRTLSIANNVILKLPSNRNIFINGALDVQGTASNPVYFTSYRDDTAGGDSNGDGSSFGARGDWDRIQFNDASNDAASLIDHAVIRYGGDNYYTRIYGAVKLVSASPTIQNTEFAHNQYCAITANLYSFPTLTSNNIHNNERNAFCLYGGDLDTDATWDITDTVYFLLGDVTVALNRTLSIANNVILKLPSNRNIFINGALDVQGTASNPVYFTSYRDDTAGGDSNGDGSSFGARGDWDRIQFNDFSDDTASQINHAVIRYGGDNYYTRIYGAVKLVSASPTIQNTEFADNQYCAITSNLDSFPTLSTNNFHDNSWNAFCLYGGDLDTDATWDITDTVYFLLGDVTVALNRTLTIANDVIVKLRSNGNIFINGAFVVSGTTSDPVIFTSYRDDTAGGDTNGDGSSFGARGDWDRIQFNDTSDDAASQIDHAVIRYGGDNYYTRQYGAMILASASPTIRFSLFTENQFAGIRTNNSTPVLECNNIYDNSNFGLYNSTSSISVTAENHWWGDPSGPYNAILNPSGTGNQVSDGVDFTPWNLDLCTDNQGPPYVTYLSPPDGATDQSLNVDLSWTGGDPDGDTVTYDVYFEQDDSSPDVLVSNDQSGTSYDPGTLITNTHYYWQIVARDEHGATASGPVWNFTTQDTPPSSPYISEVRPNRGRNDIPNDINIFGGNFQAGASARLGNISLTTTFINSNQLWSTVPAEITPGTYDLTVTNPDNGQATLSNAYTVLDQEVPYDDLFSYWHELWTDPNPPRADDTAQVGLVVHREGGKNPLSNVVVRFYLGDPDAGGTMIGDGAILLLSPRSSTSTTGVDWTPSDAITLTLYAVIDPDNLIIESFEDNNVISRTVTVLPPDPDLLAPHVDSFTINDGAPTTSSRDVTLDTTASDPSPGTGVASLFYLEYEYSQGAGLWVPAHDSGWLSYESARLNYPWQLLPSIGMKYIQAWAADNAGNISQYPYIDLINYNPATCPIAQGQSRIYRYQLSAGQRLRVLVEPVSGDPDLYVWAPDHATRPPWVSNLSTGTDEVDFVAPISGVYQVEVYGYTAATYRLTVEVTSSELVSNLLSTTGILDASKPLPSQPVVPVSLEPNTRFAVPAPLPVPVTGDPPILIYLPSIQR